MGKYNYVAVRLSPTLRNQLQAEADVRGIKITELLRLVAVNFCDNHSRGIRPKEEATNAMQR